MLRLHISVLPRAIEIVLAMLVIAAAVLLVRGGWRRAVLNVLSIPRAPLRMRAAYRDRPELDVTHSTAVTLPHGV
jgi:hypothetical protein